LEVAGGLCEQGDEFVFECTQGGTLRFEKRKGNAVRTTKTPIVDKDIAFALFDTYLGAYQTEVSPALKASIKKGLVA